MQSLAPKRVTALKEVRLPDVTGGKTADRKLNVLSAGLNNIIVKAADKGGGLVVWRADLYQKEALRQLSNTSFYAKVDKDLTSTNQQIVKSTINDLIVKQELPATATKPNNPRRPIVSACSCPTELISS